MILIDYRIGSGELLQPVRSMGVEAELADLDAADFSFSGHGDPAQCSTPLVGIERKTISDLIASMRSGRLAGFQSVRMNRIYDEQYLILEGRWRRGNRDTCVEVPRGGVWTTARGSVKYAELDRFLCSLEIQGGIRIWRTLDETETVAAVVDRYLWWQKPWEEHVAMQAIYAPEGAAGRRQGHKPQTLRRESTLAEKVASQLPGIDAKASMVAARFGSVRGIVAATEQEWMDLPGIGPFKAQQIVQAIREGESQ